VTVLLVEVLVHSSEHGAVRVAEQFGNGEVVDTAREQPRGEPVT